MEVKWSKLLIKLNITVLLEGVLSSYPMIVNSDYVQVLCLPSANHTPCILVHRVGIKFSLSEWLLPPYTTLVCAVLYPTDRTGVECDRKAQASCKRHFELNGSIPCQGQNLFNSPNLPDGICDLPCLLLKGYQEIHPWGIRRPWWGVKCRKFNLILMLRISGVILPLPYIIHVQNFPKIKEASENYKHQSCDKKQVSYWGPTIIRDLGKKFSDNCDPVARDLFNPALQTSVCEASSCTEVHYLYYNTVSSRCQFYVGKRYFMFSGRRPCA